MTTIVTAQMKSVPTNKTRLNTARAGELTISCSQPLVSLGIGFAGTSLFVWSFVHYWLFAR
jgi:hypothetical protein